MRRPPDGEQVQGLRDLLDAAAAERRGDARPGRPRRRLRARWPSELDEIDDRGARRHRRARSTRPAPRATSAARRSPTRWPPSGAWQLDLLPDDLAGTVRGCSSYEFVSSEAREHFEELIEELREEMAETYFDQMSEALSNLDPEQLRAHARGLRRAQPDARAARGGRGARPELRGVHGAVRRPVPRRTRRTSTSCSSSWPQRMAAAQAMWNSMTPEQRAQLQAPGRVAARGHGPALAGRPPGREPPARRSRRRLGAALPTSAATARWA